MSVTLIGSFLFVKVTHTSRIAHEQLNFNSKLLCSVILCDTPSFKMLSVCAFVPMELLTTPSRLLSTAQGSLLDDEVLVTTLQKSKTTSEEVTQQLAVSEETEVEIDAAREVSEGDSVDSIAWIYDMIVLIL